MSTRKTNGKFYVICVCVIALQYLIISTLFMYDDLKSLTAWSLEIWDALFHDGLINFYDYSALNLRQAPHGVTCVSYLTLIPWSIWNFPLYLISGYGAPVNSFAYLLWSKLFLLVCVAGCCFFAYKTVCFLTDNNYELAKLCIVLIAGSAEVMNSTAYAGQDEIVYLLFTLMCLYWAVRGKKVLFLLSGTIAGTLCPMMFAPLLVIMFLYEKNIWKLIRNCVIMLSPTIIFGFIYRKDAYIAAANQYTLSLFTGKLASGTMNLTDGITSLPVLLLVLLMFRAYISDKEGAECGKYMVVYAAVSNFCLCFLMQEPFFYRWGLWVPFFAILICLNNENLNLKIFIFVVLSMMRFISVAGAYEFYNLMSLSSVAQKSLHFTSEGQIFSKLILKDSTHFAIKSPIIACPLILLYLSCRKQKEHFFNLSRKVSLVAHCLLGYVPIALTFFTIILKK